MVTSVEYLFLLIENTDSTDSRGNWNLLQNDIGHKGRLEITLQGLYIGVCQIRMSNFDDSRTWVNRKHPEVVEFSVSQVSLKKWKIFSIVKTDFYQPLYIFVCLISNYSSKSANTSCDTEKKLTCILSNYTLSYY